MLRPGSVAWRVAAAIGIAPWRWYGQRMVDVDEALLKLMVIRNHTLVTGLPTVKHALSMDFAGCA